MNTEDKSIVERWAGEGGNIHKVELPDIPDGLWDDEGTEGYEAVMELKDNEKRLLWALLDNCLSEESLSQLQLAKRAGIDSHDIPIMRSRERFGRALSVCVLDRLRGVSDLIVGHLYRQSALGRSTATKLLLELIQLYTPVSRVMSMNVNVDAHDMRGKSKDEIKAEVVADWRRQGWSKEEFIQLWGED